MLLKGNFYHKGKKHKLTLKDEGLIWDTEGTPDLHQTILSSEIVSCWTCPSGSRGCFPSVGPKTLQECKHWKKGAGGLSLEVCRRKEGGRRWGPVVLVFLHVAREIVAAWHEAIWSILDSLPSRPRDLVVVINPVGGRRKAVSNFEKKVAPLFNRAGIRTSKLQTRHKGHGTRLVQEAASEGLFQCCDGIVAVGGDGLVGEIVTGLFILASLEQGVDPHDYHAEIPTTRIRLGIIPSGSTDATCFATHGSSDVVTAALHIIMGDQRCVDVATVHAENQLQRVVTSLISYGYFGDLLKSSEQWRCLGPTRYVLSGILQILRNRSYPVEIKVRKANNEYSTKGLSDGRNAVSCSQSSGSSAVSCNTVCSICNSTEEEAREDTEEDWVEVKGNYSVVSTAVSSCACRLTPQGVSPSAHLGDGYSDLIVVDGSSRTKLLSYLYHTSVTGNAANLGHVKMMRTSEIHFSAPRGPRSLFNCDGEEFETSNLSIKIHRQKLQLFCRGVDNSFSVPKRSKYKTTSNL